MYVQTIHVVCKREQQIEQDFDVIVESKSGKFFLNMLDVNANSGLPARLDSVYLQSLR